MVCNRLSDCARAVHAVSRSEKSTAVHMRPAEKMFRTSVDKVFSVLNIVFKYVFADPGINISY